MCKLKCNIETYKWFRFPLNIRKFPRTVIYKTSTGFLIIILEENVIFFLSFYYHRHLFNHKNWILQITWMYLKINWKFWLIRNNFSLWYKWSTFGVLSRFFFLKFNNSNLSSAIFKNIPYHFFIWIPYIRAIKYVSCWSLVHFLQSRKLDI